MCVTFFILDFNYSHFEILITFKKARSDVPLSSGIRGRIPAPLDPVHQAIRSSTV
jgi:hypothetical protein